MFLEFIKTAFCAGIPLLLLLSRFGTTFTCRVSANLLAVFNVLLIGHSIFLSRQLIAVYLLTRTMGDHPGPFLQDNNWLIIRLGLIVVLPLLTIWRDIRNSPWFSVIMLLLLLWVFPPWTWNLFDLPVKLASFFCLVCSAYALLWLLKRLPNQSTFR